MELEPMNILGRDAEQLAGGLFLALADLRQVFAGHLGIVRALVVVRVDDDVDVVLPLREQRQSARAAKRVVVRVRRE